MIRFLLFLTCSLCSANPSYELGAVEPPAGIVMEVTGMDYASDGTLYLCTRRGDVWTQRAGEWKRFAHGLHEPMGLCIGKKGELFLCQRPEITQLIDEDHDGRADVYHTLCDDFSSVVSFHQYTYGLVQDAAGNLWSTLSGTGVTRPNGQPGSSNAFSSEPFRMWSFKVTPAGTFTPYSSGLRTANGIGQNLQGDLFVTDNQGDWVGTSMLHHLTKGAFHGHADALRWDARFRDHSDPIDLPLTELDALRQLPAVHLPHGELMNSPGAPLMDDTAGGFGPFTGQFFIGDIVHPVIVRVALEKVGEHYQGACFPFFKGDGLEAGICRLSFTSENELLIGSAGEGNWNRGVAGKGLQKLTYKGSVPTEIHRIELEQTGFTLHFTKPLKAGVTEGNIQLSRFHYAYTPQYGSPKQDEQPVQIKEVSLSPDQTALTLNLDLEARKIYQFTLKNIHAQDGTTLHNPTAYYTLNYLRKGRERAK